MLHEPRPIRSSSFLSGSCAGPVAQDRQWLSCASGLHCLAGDVLQNKVHLQGAPRHNCYRDAIALTEVNVLVDLGRPAALEL